MPIYNVTIDDASPLISYQGVWSDTNTGDVEYVDYANKTFHATQTPGASASFTFNGTGVYVYGAKRSNHGAYTVTLDGHVSGGNGAASPDIFQQLLFSNASLPPGLHSLTLANADTGLYVDLDYVVITAGDGNTATTQSETTFDDSDPAFSYDASWGATNSSNASPYSPYYYDQTLHVTGVPNATARISFIGNAIDLYGATSSNHGAFAVSLDGGAAIVLNGTAPTFRPQTLLYRYDGLEDTAHVLSVMDLSPDPNMYVDLDYAVVWRYSGSAPPAAAVGSSSTAAVAFSASSAAAASSTPTASASSSASSTTLAAVAGALAGLLVVGLALWAVLAVLRRRWRARAGVQVLAVRESALGPPAALTPRALVVHPFAPSPARSEFDFGYAYAAPPAYGAAGGLLLAAGEKREKKGALLRAPSSEALSRMPSSSASSSSFSHG